MSQQHQTPPSAYADEISLVDIWLIIAKRKWLFLGVFISVVVLGFIYTLIQPVQYDYKLVIEIGGYRSDSRSEESDTWGRFYLLEEPKAVKAKIEESYWVQTRLKALQEFGAGVVPSELQINVPEESQIVTLMLTMPEGRSEVAAALLEGVFAKVQQDHAAILQKRVALLADLLQQRLGEVNQRINALQQSRARVVENADANTKALTMLMLDSKLQELETERARLQRQLKVGLAADVRPTQINSGPLRLPQPAGPGSMIIMLLAAVTSVMLGLLAVFLAEFLQVARIKQQQN